MARQDPVPTPSRSERLLHGLGLLGALLVLIGCAGPWWSDLQGPPLYGTQLAQGTVAGLCAFGVLFFASFHLFTASPLKIWAPLLASCSALVHWTFLPTLWRLLGNLKEKERAAERLREILKKVDSEKLMEGMMPTGYVGPGWGYIVAGLGTLLLATYAIWSLVRMRRVD